MENYVDKTTCNRPLSLTFWHFSKQLGNAYIAYTHWSNKIKQHENNVLFQNVDTNRRTPCGVHIAQCSMYYFCARVCFVRCFLCSYIDTRGLVQNANIELTFRIVRWIETGEWRQIEICIGRCIIVFIFHLKPYEIIQVNKAKNTPRTTCIYAQLTSSDIVYKKFSDNKSVWM